MAISRHSIARLLTGERQAGQSGQRSGPKQPAQAKPATGRRQQLRRIALYTRLGAVGVVLLVLAIIAGFQYAERETIRSGVHAYGVDLGGMTREEAAAALDEARDARTGQTLRLTDGGRGWSFSAAELGLTMDPEQALDDAMAAGHEGLGASRLALLWHLRSEPHEVGFGSIGVQSARLDAALDALAAEIYQDKVDPHLELVEGQPVYTSAVVGRKLDIEQTREDIVAALATGQRSVALTIDETQPVAYDKDYEAARKQLENALNAPIELATTLESWTMQPVNIAYWMTIHQARDGEPARVAIDQPWIDAVVWEITLATDRSPRSARVWWDNRGSLVVTREAEPGLELDQALSRQMIEDAFLGRTAEDRIDLPVAIDNPPALPQDLNTLGINSIIAQSSTPYGGGLPERMHNIELAARLLTGTLVMPGQTFSFNAEIGEMTTDAGFQIGYGIAKGADGELSTIPAEAGGICQVSTTVFQPVFWSGYQIDQRSTHSYWIPTYAYNGMIGMDSTVEPALGLDFKWTNNSSTAVLIEATADGQNFHVILYGTPPAWRVEIDPPVISNVEEADPEVHYEGTTDLPVGHQRQIERAHDGFDVSITRRVIAGDTVETTVWTAQYGPSRNVVLVGTETGELPEGWAPES